MPNKSSLPLVEKRVEPSSQTISNNFKLNCLFFAAGIGALALIIIGLSIAALPLMVPAVVAAGLATTAYGVGGGVASVGVITGLGVGAGAIKKGFFSNSSPAPDAPTGDLDACQGHEPAFFDDFSKDPELAAYYLRHINILHHFCSYIEKGTPSASQAINSEQEISPAPSNISNNFKLNCLFFAAGIGALALIIIGIAIAALPLMALAVVAAGLATTAYGVGSGIASVGVITGLGVGVGTIKNGSFSSSPLATDTPGETPKPGPTFKG